MNKKTYHRLTIITLALAGMLVFPVSSFGAEKLVVKDGLGTTQFRVLDDGSVGIGIAPTSKLHVNSYEATQDIQGSRFSYTTEATAGYGNIGLFSEATSAPPANATGEVYTL